MPGVIDRFRDLPPRSAFAILGISVSVLLAGAFFGFGLGFQPGWANGWPNVSKHTVFAAGMTGMLFLWLVPCGVAALIVPCCYLQRITRREFVGWGSFALLMLLWSALAVWLCSLAFPALHADIIKEWP